MKIAITAQAALIAAQIKLNAKLILVAAGVAMLLPFFYFCVSFIKE